MADDTTQADDRPNQIRRYRLTIEYDGTPYKGFQRQENAPSVQQAIERTVHRFTGQTITLFGAGRTDSGVHASGQVVHFDLALTGDRELPSAFRVLEAMNALLLQAGDPVAVLDCAVVPESFHARFSADGRRYLYRIVNRRAPLTFQANRAWWVRKGTLDAAAMDRAAKRLLGTHDFTTFRSVNCQAKSPIRTLDRLDVETDGSEITVHAEARSFLHNQVRSMVGALKMVGEGRWTDDDLVASLEARDRKACAAVAPACGLYLTGVRYDGVWS